MRVPAEEDGTNIWELIKNTEVLDLNSPYCYLILCKYFNNTCVVAEKGNEIVGFISAFYSPIDPEILFVWQVAVDKTVHRRGLGMMMLKHLLKRNQGKINYLEITVNPSNDAAYRLYYKLAAELDTSVEENECFPTSLFPGRQHEKEIMLRIGPLI